MKHLSKISNGLIGQPMFRLLSKIKEMERSGKKITHFEIGDPSFDTPPEVVRAAKASLDDKETHYTDSRGLWELRDEICAFTNKKLGYKPSIEQVLIAPANAIIDYVVQCVVDPGEEVIYPDPGFPTYRSVLNYAGMKSCGVSLREENGFRMDPDDIRKKITKKTRLMIINSPQNPTGSMMTEDEIDEVASIAEEQDLYLLSDEVYSEVVYDKAHYSPSRHDGCKDRVITLNSFSKIYSMSGWRIGYAVGPAPVVAKMGLILETTISCLPAFTQRGAIAALRSDRALVRERNEELRLRRDAIVKGLNSIPGVTCLVPDGAFYVFANIKNTGLSAERLTDLLLEKADVGVIYGSCFGNYGDGYIRLCYASTSLETIEQALDRMREVVQEEVAKGRVSVGGQK
jgi:aspartate/methionine/tyrosine aminotransferase